MSHWDSAELLFCSEELSFLPYKNQNKSVISDFHNFALSLRIIHKRVYHRFIFTILNAPAVVDGRGSLSSHMRHLANEACHTVRLFKQSSSICSYLRNGLLHACMNNLSWNKIVICPWLALSPNNIKIFFLWFTISLPFTALLKDLHKSFACYI